MSVVGPVVGALAGGVAMFAWNASENQRAIACMRKNTHEIVEAAKATCGEDRTCIMANASSDVLEKCTKGMVTAHVGPVISTGIGLGAGALIGWIVSRYVL